MAAEHIQRASRLQSGVVKDEPVPKPVLTRSPSMVR